MSQQGPAPNSAQSPEENQVRQLLALTATSGLPTDSERDRIAEAMWEALDQPIGATGSTRQLTIVPSDQPDRVYGQAERRNQRTTRVLLWAAMLLLIAATFGLIRTTTGQILEPAAPTDPTRTTVQIGNTEMSFDAAIGYAVETEGPATVTLVADQTNLRSHERITIAQTEEVFGGQDPADFFATADLQAERVAAPDGSTAWLVSVDTAPGCSLGHPCMTIAMIVGGEPLKLVAGTYSRIEVYDNNDSGPVVVVSEVGSRTNGPALVNVELTH